MLKSATSAHPRATQRSPAVLQVLLNTKENVEIAGASMHLPVATLALGSSHTLSDTLY